MTEALRELDDVIGAAKPGLVAGSAIAKPLTLRLSPSTLR